MSEFSRVDENRRANIDQLFAKMRNVLKCHEQNEAKLQNENKTLCDENTSLHSTMNRLIGVNSRQQTMIDTFHQSLNKLEKRNSLLQKKIVELKKTIVLQNQNTAKQDLSDYYDEQTSRLKMGNNSFTVENKSLIEHLSNFQHVQIVSGIHLNNVKKYDCSQQTSNNTCTPFVSIDHDEFEQNELKPLRVNVIDYDVEN